VRPNSEKRLGKKERIKLREGGENYRLPSGGKAKQIKNIEEASEGRWLICQTKRAWSGTGGGGRERSSLS